MKITFFIDATIQEDDSGFVTTCCLLDRETSCKKFNEETISELYEDGKLLLSSVPFDAVVTFKETEITFNEAVTTSIEQILIDSSIDNLKRKLLVINPKADLESMVYEIVYFDTIARYKEVLEESIEGNEDINIEIEMIDCHDIDLYACPGFEISSIQNEKYLKKNHNKG